MTEKSETWTTLKVLNWTKSYLAEKGVENARLEAEWLLCAALNLDRVGLYLNFDKPLLDSELAAYRSMVARRAKREPLQHILGSQEFMGLDFDVSPSALVPRYDTEVLVNETLKRAAPQARVLDIGTGSGCVAIAIAKSLPAATVVSVDVSQNALSLARQNSDKFAAKVDFRHGSLFEPVADECFNLIVSNPPYIPTADIAGLEPEVREFEPLDALDGGSDGLDFYRKIVCEAPSHLTSQGWLVFEVGIGQAADVANLLQEAGFGGIFTAVDSGGVERVVGGQFA